MKRVFSQLRFFKGSEVLVFFQRFIPFTGTNSILILVLRAKATRASVLSAAFPGFSVTHAVVRVFAALLAS